MGHYRLFATLLNISVICVLLFHLRFSPATGHASKQSGCSSDLDCSLNGRCVVASRNQNDFDKDASHTTTTCVCEKPWSGDYCEELLFLPTKGTASCTANGNNTATAASILAPQGYGMTPNTTTWGGNILVEPINASHTKYHLYVSRMTNDCPLTHWQTNSRIDHAVSVNNMEGPYEFSDVAIPTFSHNPAPIVLQNATRGKFAIFHIGAATTGPNGGKNCTSPLAMQRQLQHSVMPGGIHVSDSFNGPWKPVLDHNLPNCNNPAPWVHPTNGTLYVLCAHGKSTLYRSQHGSVEGPYEYVTEFQPKSQAPVPTNYEDPFLYTDANNNFHVLYHAYQYAGTPDDCDDSVVSAHAYSIDGYDWHVSSVPPYGTQLRVDCPDGSTTVTLATRERPKLVLQNGILTHMVEGVCGASGCSTKDAKHCVNCKYRNWDFTLISTFDRS